jgi:dolichol-phosphate mannosyltransferase
MRKIKVVFPAYNEELSLPSLLRRLDSSFVESGLQMEALVVNDGSKDSTPDIVRQYKGNIKVNLLDLQPNRGLAGAIRAGLTEAVKGMHDDDIIVTLDADDSQNPYLIPRMVNQICEGSDIVIASRYQHGARIVGLTRFREFMSSGAGILFRIVAGLRGVKDYTCGFRAYRVGLLKQGLEYYQDRFVEQKGFGCMAEILLKLYRFEPVIHEVPMILRYDRKEGASKMNVGKTARQTLHLLYLYKTTNQF